MAEKLLSPKLRVDEAPLEADLRPRTLDEFVGQEKMKENLAIFLEAARARGEALEHLLLCGPPGLGKTTLANIVAKEMGVGIRITSGPAVEKVRDFATVVSKLDRYEVLFVDEVHRLPRPVEEMLYPAMEDRRLDIIVGKGLQARTLRLPLNPFTVIGATTRTALLTSPLRARFGVTYRLDFYDVESMERIVHRSAGILGVEIDDKAAREIAERSRGTPRVANRLLKRLRDYAEVRAEGKITLQVAREALELLEVDRLGLDEVDRKVIETVIDRFGGGPVGLDAIAAAVGEESDTIMDVHEPYLLRLGFIDRTPRGRIAARPAYEHLGLPFASSANVPNQEREQPSLL